MANPTSLVRDESRRSTPRAANLPLPSEDTIPPISSLLFQPPSSATESTPAITHEPVSFQSLPSLPPLSQNASVTPGTPGSPSKSPRRIHTDPDGEVRVKMFKRIVICCDGTWQDGLSVTQRSRYTNVLRLARSIEREDSRLHPAISQIVFYQSGIGTENNFYSEYVEGTTGASLADKVEEAYGFIAHNYNPGDEIFLFGFSRGAYTARMVAAFVGEIGILDHKDMDSFAKIFIAFQQLGKVKDVSKRETLEAQLEPWRSLASRGKNRADIDGDTFTIKFLGVWDTVGALGLPEEVPLRKKAANLFGFNDSQLGPHIERACQALALNEMRLDFVCNKFHQTDEGRSKNQYLKQVWFAGCHSDIGGGYNNHDLADLPLIWMAAELDKFLSLDITYLQQLIQPVAPWGTQQPHDSATGIFSLATRVDRPLPTRSNDEVTHEFIHPSVLYQVKKNAGLASLVQAFPDLVCPLQHLEEVFKERWPYDGEAAQARAYAARLRTQETRSKFLSVTKSSSWIQTLYRTVSSSSSSSASRRESFSTSSSRASTLVYEARVSS